MSDLIKMLSTGTTKDGKPTGTFYVTKKNKKTKTDKITLMRFDARAFDPKRGKRGIHVKYVETKI